MIKRITNKIKRTVTPYVIRDKKNKYNDIPIVFSDFKRIVVFETTFGWNGIMMQRPQQVASSFDKDTLVLYHSSKDKYENGACWKKVNDNLFIINLDVYRKYLLSDPNTPKDKILVIYSTDPTSIKIIEEYKNNGYGILYEYVDDLNPALSSRRVYVKLLEKYKYMMDNKVKTVCTATRLYNNVKEKTNAVLVTNGCDYGHFKASEYELPYDMDFKSGKHVIGYYGAVAEWMDYKLLEKIANTGDFDVVLLGVDYDGSFDQSGIGKSENIHFLGKKQYDVLPSYAAHFDVCIIPFVCNELTASTSPVKLFEYMAAEKPIITTDLAECRKYSSVMCAGDHDEFIEYLYKAIEIKDDPAYKALLRKEALENTWQSKCKDIIEFAFA